MIWTAANSEYTNVHFNIIIVLNNALIIFGTIMANFSSLIREFNWYAEFSECIRGMLGLGGVEVKIKYLPLWELTVDSRKCICSTREVYATEYYADQLNQ